VRDDGYDLRRFVDAQEGVYPVARGEIEAGRKRGHWMWFILPQLRGLGTSEASTFYGIASLDEARAYWSHPILGPRLRECVETAIAVPGKSALEIFGAIDRKKLRSCLTLFAAAAPAEPLFVSGLDRFFDGLPCRRTLDLLNREDHVGES
jgi:uncharacterized protein (DUF1810 family)